MKEFDPLLMASRDVSSILLAGIAPRPIALVSTIDKEGNPNLSPFSFYNAFGVNPTTLIFSPSRRGRDNTVKHTYENIKEVPEVVIHAVTYDMVQQTSLSSTEYEKWVNEFKKSGFTAIPSVAVKPFRVKESPLHFECKVRDVIETGKQGGSANLVICEILKIHINEKFLDGNNKLQTEKLDLVGRMGEDVYVRASGDALFHVPKPLLTHGIGVDALPDTVRLSKVLSGNDLGILGNIEKIPDFDRIRSLQNNKELGIKYADRFVVHQKAKELISIGHIEEALELLFAFG